MQCNYYLKGILDNGMYTVKYERKNTLNLIAIAYDIS